MGYERDEAMRQQEATEAMIRMREPRRPSDGPFMPCPAKAAPITPDWRVEFKSEITMPRNIPDAVMEPGIREAMLTDCGRIQRLTIISPTGDSIDMALEVNKHGSQIGEFNIVGPDGGMNIPSEVRMVMGLFLCLDFAGIAHLVKVEAVSG